MTTKPSIFANLTQEEADKLIESKERAKEHVNDKPAREFDALTALKFWTHQAPDNWIQMSESQICVFGARMQFEQDQPLYQALKLENERLSGLRECPACGAYSDAKAVKDWFSREMLTHETRTLKAENAELRVEVEKLNGIYTSAVKGRQEFRSVAREGFKTNAELQSEVARLRLGIRAAMTDLYSEASEPKRLVLVAIADQLREALNHKPKGEKE